MTDGPIRIAVLGPEGRMGAALCTLVAADRGLVLVARVQPPEVAGLHLDALDAATVDVLIDFTHREAVADHAAWATRHRVAWVLGTTGLTPADQALVDAAAQATVVFQASNFSLGVALLADLAARAARVLGLQADVEILETHHHSKRDAPSGTAVTLGRAVAEARGQQLEAVQQDGRTGPCGARPAGEIGFHAIRLADVVGEHEVWFGWPGERLKLSHDARDRSVFAHGALRAARFAAERRRLGQLGRFGMAELVLVAG